MSGDDEHTADSISGAPIDFDRLNAIRERFAAGDRFSRIDEQPAFAPDRLVCVYDQRFSPTRVRAARLEIVWFENGDFSLHYHEEHESGTFDHRWDRHPSDRNSRDTFIRGPTHRVPVTIRRIRQAGETSSRWSFRRSRTDRCLLGG